MITAVRHSLGRLSRQFAVLRELWKENEACPCAIILRRSQCRAIEQIPIRKLLDLRQKMWRDGLMPMRMRC